jgi:hypothetical protein
MKTNPRNSPKYMQNMTAMRCKTRTSNSYKVANAATSLVAHSLYDGKKSMLSWTEEGTSEGVMAKTGS